MIMSAHQPAYLPWLGYIDKIKRSDVFLFLDDVQFEKNSFTNRNRIKTANGPIWLTIPVIKTDHFDKVMSDMLIDKRSNWQKKHLNSIRMAYAKAPNFKKLYERLQELYSKDYDYLVDATWDHLMFWLDVLDIHTKVIRASSLGNIEGKKSDFVLDLCRAVGADHYISGKLGADYLEVDKFAKAGIEVEYQEYQHPIYPQLYGDFIEDMGVVDLAMNTEDYSII